jgi:Family of unknown function (DUF5343)
VPVTSDKSAPYAPASAVIDVVNRYRNRGLPIPVTVDVLARVGISDSLLARTLQALQALDLIDEAGNPTSVLEGIRIAPEAEFKPKLAEWLNGAYAEIVSVADPASDDDTRVRDAFRTFTPFGQQDRMVTLFVQLFRWAGVRNDQQSAQRTERTPSKQSKTSARTSTKSRSDLDAPAAGHKFATGGQVHPALAGLLASLPTNKDGWSKSKRDAFLRSFEAVLDFVIPISNSEEQELDSVV